MTANQNELRHLLQAAYSAGIIDATNFVDSKITTGEIRGLTEELAQSYALKATTGQAAG